jgi:hypothetical protein
MMIDRERFAYSPRRAESFAANVSGRYTCGKQLDRSKRATYDPSEGLEKSAGATARTRNVDWVSAAADTASAGSQKRESRGHENRGDWHTRHVRPRPPDRDARTRNSKERKKRVGGGTCRPALRDPLQPSCLSGLVTSGLSTLVLCARKHGTAVRLPTPSVAARRTWLAAGVSTPTCSSSPDAA